MGVPGDSADNTARAPHVALSALDTLWFQVTGTLCNLACRHCFISCSPTNHTHEMMTLAAVREHLADAVPLGLREVYFTGGEPFLHRELEAMLAAALAVAPTTVLTNGLLLDPARCERLAALARASPYSLDVRVSLDGCDAATHDAVRGAGTFARALAGIEALAGAGFDPVVTASEVEPANGTPATRRRFLELLAERGVRRPRLKLLPLFRLGAEVERSAGYAAHERLRASDHPGASFEHLQCSSCRMATAEGVWVCPILVNEPTARLGTRLADALAPFELTHAACWTCHEYGVSCRT